MKTDTQKARAVLEVQGLTCVLCKKDALFTATDRGVKPLLNWLDSGIDFAGFCAADKVVGRATAFLYVLLGISEVYAQVMSRPAMEVLEQHDIAVHAVQSVDGIINRRGTGPCPFEAAVMGITHAPEALSAIRRKLTELQNSTHPDT